MSHSPEPWRGDEPIRSGTDFWDSCPVIRDSEGVAIAAVMDLANLRRIVACVNACRGLDTEYIEDKQVHMLLSNGELVMNGTREENEAFAAEYLRAHGYTVAPPKS